MTKIENSKKPKISRAPAGGRRHHNIITQASKYLKHSLIYKARQCFDFRKLIYFNNRKSIYQHIWCLQAFEKMGRRKKLFGRSKETKQKNAQLQQLPAGQEHSHQEDVLQKSSSSVRSGTSPLLVAKARRSNDLSSRGLADTSNHSNSSGTIFIPVEDSSQSIKSTNKSIGSGSTRRSKSRSKPSPLLLGKASTGTSIPEDMNFRLSAEIYHDHDYEDQKGMTDMNLPDVPHRNRLPLPPRETLSIPPNMQPQLPFGQMNMRRPPPARLIVEELFKINDEDSILAERYLKLLRDALEIEGTAFQNGEIELSFDPTDTFFCIKQVAERYHSRWSDLKSRRSIGQEKKLASEIVMRDNIKNEEKETKLEIDQAVEEQGAKETVKNNIANPQHESNDDLGFDPADIDSSTWTDLEQISWEIFELSMWSCAVLATLCIGPAWKNQIKKRRMRLHSARLENLRRNHSKQSKLSKRASTATSTTSSLTQSQSNQQKVSFHRKLPEKEVKDIYENEEPRYPSIPEVLPISMLQFAATFGDTILPLAKYPDVEVILTKDEVEISEESSGRNEENNDDFSPAHFSGSVTQLIWEEQRNLIRRQRLGDAQREIVAALITEDGEDNQFDGNKRYKWSIPGAHDPVAMMIRAWVETTLMGWPNNTSIKLSQENSNLINSTNLQVLWGTIAVNETIDWWNAFQVSKFVSDLTTAGWRPPPGERHGKECILRLVALAEKGILLLPQDMKNSARSTNEMAREEILAASSTSAEVLSALNHLGGRGCLPETTVKSVSRSLCQLLSLTDESISEPSYSLFLMKSGHSTEMQDLDNGIMQEIEAFAVQRETCLHEIAELLWSMMARNSSMASTTDALLGVINIDLSNDAIFNSDIFCACGAVRSLGASLWGNPPHVRGNSSLRLCWSLFFELLSETTSSVHDWSACQKSPVQKEDTMSTTSSFTGRIIDNGFNTLGNTFLTIPKLKEVSDYDLLSLNLVLEVAIAVRRLVDGDLASGVDILCLHEWEQLLVLLEKGLLPWLANLRSMDTQKDSIGEQDSMRYSRNNDLLQKIQAEVSCIFLQMKIYLGHDLDGDVISHRIVHETIRTRFYLLFFRMVLPRLPSGASSHIALSIINSWVCEEAILFSSIEWHKTCSVLLSEVFAFYKDSNSGYDGGYVHSLFVRQAAMRALIQLNPEGWNVQEGSPLSALDESTNIESKLVARKARSVHADTVCRVLFPYICEVLHMAPFRNGLHLPEPYPAQSFEEDEQESRQLILSAVQIAGSLLLSPNLDHREHTKLMNILSTCALDSPMEPSHRRNISNGLLGDILKQNDYGEKCKLKLETVRQLGLYLRASFGAQGVSRTPEIVDLLVNIVNTFCDNAGHEIVAIAAMFQLTCIRLGNDGEAILLDELIVLSSFPPTTIDFNERLMFVMEIIASLSDPDDNGILEGFSKYHPDAPMGTVTTSNINLHIGTGNELDSKNLDLANLDLSPLIETMKRILSALPDKDVPSNESSSYLSFITAESDASFQLKALCLETLHSFIQCGLVKKPVLHWSELSPLVQNTQPCLSQCKLLSGYAAFILEDTNDSANSNSFFKQLLASCISRNRSIVRVGCQGLSLYFAAISNKHCDSLSTKFHDACLNLIEKLQSLVESKLDSVLRIPLLTTLLNVISSYNPILHYLSDRTKANIVILCHQICSDFSGEMCPQTLLLCLQCAATAAATIGIDELGNLICRVSGRSGSISHTTEIPGELDHLQIANVIFDILVQHCLSKSESYKSSPLETKKNPKESNLSETEFLAKDIEDIESFDVAQFDGHGAWLCNDLVLICRVGSNDSRHRGYVEITLRSPSTRVRKLVRLSNRMSLKCPDLPCNLWDAVLTSKDAPSTLHYSKPFIHTDGDHPTADVKTIAFAKQSMRRFKDMNNRGRNNAGVDSQSSQNSSLRSFMGLAEDIIAIKNSVSTNNIDQLKSETKHPPLPDASFRNFLFKALRANEKNIQEVENALHELDCSIPILDSVYDISDEPLPLKWDSKLRRACNVLDRTAFLQTHKVRRRWGHFLLSLQA